MDSSHVVIIIMAHNYYASGCTMWSAMRVQASVVPLCALWGVYTIQQTSSELPANVMPKVCCRML